MAKPRAVLIFLLKTLNIYISDFLNWNVIDVAY